MEGRRQLHCSILAVEIILPLTTKIVLMVAAARSCNHCGLVWIGLRRWMEESGLRERSVQKALQELVRLGHFKERAYVKGGRGRTTQYIILPELRELSTAPCAKCLFFMENPAPRAPFDKELSAKPRTTYGVLAKPRTTDPQNPARGAGLTNQEPITNQGVDRSTTEHLSRGAATPHFSDPTQPNGPPETLAESRATVETILTKVGSSLAPGSPKKPDRT